MAGQDTEYRGEAQLAPGATVGLLEQEPQLDETKDVRGNVEDGVRRDCARCSTASTSSPRTTPTRPPTSSRACRSRSTPPTPGTSTRSSTRRWTRCACRPPTPTSPSSPAASAAASRSAGCCSRAPDLLLLDEPTNHLDAESVGVARAAPRGVQGHDRRRHPRSLLPRQRRGLDPRARPRPRPPVQGQLLELARAEAGAPRAGGAARSPRASARSQQELEWVRKNPKGRRNEVQGAPEQLRGAARRGAQRQARRRSRSTSRPGRASATR